MAERHLVDVHAFIARYLAEASNPPAVDNLASPVLNSTPRPPVAPASAPPAVSRPGVVLQRSLAGRRLLDMQRSMFSVVDKLGHPISCGAFVTDAGVALIVTRLQRLRLCAGSLVRAVMLQRHGRVGDKGPGYEEVMLLFRVHAILPALQCACLVPVTALPVGTFKPLPVSEASPAAGASPLMTAEMALLPASAAYNRYWHRQLTTYDHHSCRVIEVRPDTLVYRAEPVGVGEWGGALIVTADGLVAMHERCSDTDDFETTADGIAIRVDQPEVRAAVQAADEAARASSAGEVGAGAAGSSSCAATGVAASL